MPQFVMVHQEGTVFSFEPVVCEELSEADISIVKNSKEGVPNCRSSDGRCVYSVQYILR